MASRERDAGSDPTAISDPSRLAVAPLPGDAPSPAPPLTAADSDSGPAEPTGPLSALSNRNFRLYWLGQIISYAGTWMQASVLGWVLANLTTSATAIALSQFIFSLPMIALALPAGHVVDQFDRRKILILSQLCCALVAAAYGVLVSRDLLSLPIVYALAFVLGTVGAIDFPAANAILPALVPPSGLASAISLNQAAFHGARIVGPALAGVATAAFGLPSAFFANSVSYLVVVVTLLVIRLHPRPAGAHGPGAPGGGGRSPLDGLRYVRGNPEVLAVLGLTALTTALIFPLLVVYMPLFVKSVLGGDRTAFLRVMCSSGVGAVVGAGWNTRVHVRDRRRRLFFSASGAALCVAAISQIRSSVTLAFAAVALAFCVSTTLGLGNIIIQAQVPDRLRGRVMALHGVTFTGLMPACALAMGPLNDAFGLPSVLLGVAILYGVASISWLVRAGFLHGQAETPA